MDNTITALKNIYVALGGSADDVENIVIIPDMLNALAALLAEGEIAVLPTVTADDNGKVLTVAAGSWSAVTPTPELPAVTADDNGDVLTVSNGAWAAVTPTPELPAVTSDDNGDVLTVVEGAWAAAALPT